jgi:hypothetical protein
MSSVKPEPTTSIIPQPVQPTGGTGAIFYLVPVAIVLFLILLCSLIRLVPMITFYFRKPKITTSEQVQINYLHGDCETATNTNLEPPARESLHTNSIALRPSTMSLSVGAGVPLHEMQSLDSIIYVLEGTLAHPDEEYTLRSARSNALITVGEPPNYNETVIDSPLSRQSLDLEITT